MKPKALKINGWIILNAWGGLWTHTIFYTETGAQKHVDEFKKKYSKNAKFKILEANVLIYW